MSDEYRVPMRVQLVRPIIRSMFRTIFRVLGRVKISGVENVPLKQAYAVAINHISIFDPPLLVSFWPETAEVLGAANVFEKKGQGLLLKLYGVIPVHRGDYDRVLLETMIAILRSGHPLVIAPEGGRSHETAMHHAKPGVGYIIERANVPVIPVGIVGTTDDFWQHAKRGEKPKLEIRIGKPIRFPPIIEKGAVRREARQQYADLIMSHIAGLLPPEYRGVYADSAILP
ncbi:MAG: 1-acyl-sn-glycerol-3-phosphate acyltransferase [Anaerolineales bacterium]|nr:1-acyl-sn-glycerol-3-phosphate acyltransferase [Anaerolineales bacterium]